MKYTNLNSNAEFRMVYLLKCIVRLCTYMKKIILYKCTQNNIYNMLFNVHRSSTLYVSKRRIKKRIQKKKAVMTNEFYSTWVLSFNIQLLGASTADLKGSSDLQVKAHKRKRN